MSYLVQEFDQYQETQPSISKQRAANIDNKPVEIFALGQRIDNYEIRRILGKGATGCVYEAYDTVLKRDVAIKALWPDKDTKKLYQEATVLASMRHPSLVTVYGVGVFDEIPYLVLERLYGMTLREYIDDYLSEGGCSVAEALEILASIAEVLQVIHGHRMVHRDVKPSNIMLESGGRVVLLDFGLFARMDDPYIEMSGTPYYMAPETVARIAGTPRAAVDIYALGVIAFELLTGKRPFEGKRIDEVLYKHLREAPPEIVGRHADISEHACQIIHEMLAKDPNDRPPTAGEIGMWLRALQSGEAIREQSPALSILIVDDDPAMAELLCACVQHAAPNARLLRAADGAEALSIFRTQPPQLMIMDVNMPNMSGLELCSYLRSTKLSARTSIIAVSGYDSDTRRQLLAQMGVAAFLGKRQHSHMFITELIERVAELNQMHTTH